MTDAIEYRTPEFFFGSLTHDSDSLFTYTQLVDESGNTKAPLTGWLRRGVAGIEVKLGNVTEDTRVKKVELLADSLHTQVKGRVYDDFLTPYAMKVGVNNTHFVIAVDSLSKEHTKFEQDSVRLMYANVLPVCSSLSLRITKQDTDGKISHEYCHLRVRQTNVIAPPTKTIPGGNEDEDGNGTGIIPDKPDYPDQPEDPEPENPYRICFERNHYYRIKGDFNKLTLNEYVLQVTVNPNWDGSVSLTLGK